MMKKLLCTLVAASAVGLMGCPPPSNSGNNPPSTDTATKAPDTSTPSTDGAAPATEAGKTDAPPPATEAAKPAAADLSHVKAGQKYHYEMQNNMQQIWTVDEVTADTVKYKTQMIMNGNPLGDPQAAEWKWTAPAAATTTATTDQPAAKISREKVTVSGTEFDCMVSEANGAKAWVPTKGGEYNVTFPGILKSQMADGSVVMELKKIE